jgi:ketosteroid isomerase-like protein
VVGPVSEENVAIVRGGYEEFRRRGSLVRELVSPEFVWDMSHFHGWPEQQLYEGVQGAEHFIEEWTSAWDDWDLVIEELHDAGEKVLAVHRQRGRSKSTGLPVDMSFAMVWTLRNGKQTRMEMYSDVGEALKAVGLEK